MRKIMSKRRRGWAENEEWVVRRNRRGRRRKRRRKEASFSSPFSSSFSDGRVGLEGGKVTGA